MILHSLLTIKVLNFLHEQIFYQIVLSKNVFFFLLAIFFLKVMTLNIKKYYSKSSIMSYFISFLELKKNGFFSLFFSICLIMIIIGIILLPLDVAFSLIT